MDSEKTIDLPRIELLKLIAENLYQLQLKDIFKQIKMNNDYLYLIYQNLKSLYTSLLH